MSVESIGEEITVEFQGIYQMVQRSGEHHFPHQSTLVSTRTVTYRGLTDVF